MSPERSEQHITEMSYETALGASTPDTITLLGKDLARDVMGEVGFGELAFWLATQQRPTRGQTRVFEAVLAAAGADDLLALNPVLGRFIRGR